MNPDVGRPLVVRFCRAFLYAGRGVAIVSRDRNFRTQSIAGAAVVLVSAWLGLSAIEWAVLAVTIAGVLATEAMNSAVEACVNLATSVQHPLAARAKDVAAGAVLLASCGAVAVGLLLLGPKLWQRLM